MHYLINDLLVKSELAAKSIRQPNKYVIEYINQLPSNYTVLDYGCGKLRYTIPLSQRVKQVVAIDSKEQLSKSQVINGVKTTLSNVNIKNVRIYNLDDKDWKNENYDLVFCTNVLSAIPFEDARLELLKQAAKLLKNDGKIFIVVQYRNSYFSQYKKRNTAEFYNKGWLLHKNQSQCFYYAPLTSEYIISLCEKVGLTKFIVKKRDGSCFIVAQK